MRETTKGTLMHRAVAASGALLLLCSSSFPTNAAQDIVLDFDHEKREWQIPKGVSIDDFQVDLNGVATVFLPRAVRLRVRVLNTNPLLFSVTRGEVKTEDISGLKDLQDFVTGLGGVLGRLVAIKTAPSRVAPMHYDAAEKAVRTFASFKEKLHMTACAAETVVDNRRAIVLFLNGIEAARGKTATIQLELKPLRYDPGAYSCVPAPPVSPIDVRTASDALQALQQAYWSLRKQDVPRTQDPAVDKEIAEILAAADKLLTGSGALVTGAAEIQAFVDRMNVAGITSKGVTFSFQASKEGTRNETIDLGIVTSAVKWNKKITRPAKLRIDSSFSKDVVTSRPELDFTYATAWRGGSLLGVGVGLVYTPLTQPIWTAATKPGDPSVKVVTQTGEESRAGTFGLFLNFRIFKALAPSTRTSWFVPALQIGTGFDPKKASLYAGGAFELFSYVRLGVGCTWQLVQRLNGQTEGVTQVSGDSDIKTRDGFDHRYYVSLSVAIDNLSLFSKPN